MAGLVAEGTAGSLLALGSFETSFEEGESGTLEIDMVFIPFGLISALQLALDIAGVDAEVSSAPGSVVVVDFTKSLGLIAIAIALTVVFVAATLLLVIAWALFRDVINPFTVGLGLVALVGIVAVVLTAGGRSRARQKR